MTGQPGFSRGTEPIGHQIDRQTDGQMDGQTDIDRYLYYGELAPGILEA